MQSSGYDQGMRNPQGTWWYTNPDLHTETIFGDNLKVKQMKWSLTLILVIDLVTCIRMDRRLGACDQSFSVLRASGRDGRCPLLRIGQS